MKASETRVMTLDQLTDKLAELKREQFNLRVQQATGQLENLARRRLVRRDIARIQTIIGEKRSSGAGA
ncbi:MAG: 50S ribosomal protein L29 [Alphaproteobacteria bacterium]|nr:50S ribosomal protein L29 [Alphaproteobacteria bacterium]